MAKQVASKWRQSASLILLAKQTDATAKTKFNYKTLLFERAAKSSFMPNSMVFPGGKHETVDAAPTWLEHFKKFGIKNAQLEQLTANRPWPQSLESEHKHELASQIALRITAIRETFEEVGVLLCRSAKTANNSDGYAHALADFERAHWQKLVHNDASQFLTLCQELEVLPDLWNLHEWSAWLTPSTFKKRFVTAFFVAALPQQPDLLIEDHEVASYGWRTPLDFLLAGRDKQLWLPPPQVYELSRCLNFNKLEELRTFAATRAPQGISLIHPVMYKCSDGAISLLPGDSMYPSDPDISDKAINLGTVTMEQYRADAIRLHRWEYKNQYEPDVLLNYDLEYGHLRPLNVLQCKNIE